MLGQLAERWSDMEPRHPGYSANVAFCDAQEGPDAHVMFMGDQGERVHEDLREALRYSLTFDPRKRFKADSRVAGTCSWANAEGLEVSFAYNVLFM